MTSKKIIALYIILFTSPLLCYGPLKEYMPTKEVIQNTSEGAAAGVCVGLGFGILCSPCQTSLITSTTLCCIIGACIGLATNTTENKR